MTGKGHVMSGLVLSTSVYVFSKDLNAEPILSTIFFIFGSTAPDWLEIRKKGGGTIIKHRTITHWTPLWILMFYGLFYLITNNYYFFNVYENYQFYIYSALFGFSMGGILHLLLDLPNPMGIPMLTPYHRFSLNLWKSGKNETFIILVLMIFNLYYLGVIDFNLDSLSEVFN